MKQNQDTVRSLALLGAKVRLSELEQLVKDTRDVIKALQASGSTRPGTRKRYTDKFKAKVVAAAKDSTVSEAAEKYKVHTNQIYKWMRRNA